MGSSRILFVPAESGDFRQNGLRRPLADLLSAGLISEVSVFSLDLRIHNGAEPEEQRQQLIQRVKEFQPDIIFIQHIGSTGLTAKHFLQMRKAADFELIYHEGDPYTRFLHPLRRPVRAIAPLADVVFTVGSKYFANNFLKVGAKDVRWVASAFDPARFSLSSAVLNTKREVDVVMVAHKNTPRLRGLPNWKDRISFVEKMQNHFGERFAIYGRNWDLPSARGPIDYLQQSDVLMTSWVSANWDHFAYESDYFSDRLPISLASGSVHAAGSHPGFDRIFEKLPATSGIFAETHEALIENIEQYLIQHSVEQRIEHGLEASKFAHKHFRADDQLVEMLNFNKVLVNPLDASACWDIGSSPLSEI